MLSLRAVRLSLPLLAALPLTVATMMATGTLTAAASTARPASFVKPGELASVAALSASNVWAVGDTPAGRSLIAHFNGHAWKQVASPKPGGSATLSSVAVISARNAWAVGQDGTSTHKALTLHWNGRFGSRSPILAARAAGSTASAPLRHATSGRSA